MKETKQRVEEKIECECYPEKRKYFIELEEKEEEKEQKP